jgi:GT2 family glycosyltransferase
MSPGKIDLSIIIVSYNTIDLLRGCLKSIDKVISVQNDFAAEVIVVDNGSRDGSVQMVSSEFPSVHLLAENNNLGFGVANNVGANAANGEFLLLINSDTEVDNDVGRGLVEYLRSNPTVGCVAPKIVLPDGTSQPKVLGNLPTPWRLLVQSVALNRLFNKSKLFSGIDIENYLDKEAVVGWVSGVCLCIRRSHYNSIGGFDPRFFMYCEDIELCLRIGKNIGSVVHLDAYPVLHYGGASSKSTSSRLRNTIWQQRNLLMTIHIHQGIISTILAKLIIAPGLLLRIAVGMLMTLGSTTGKPFLMRSAWLRLLDLAGLLRKLPE